MRVPIIPEDPRDAVAAARPHQGPSKPHLKPAEMALFVLMSHRDQWFLVDRWRKADGAISAMCVALRRRGCEVFVRHHPDGIRGYARWTHEVPTFTVPAPAPAPAPAPDPRGRELVAS